MSEALHFPQLRRPYCFVGDGHTLFNVASSISQLYQGKNPLVTPTFEKHLQPIPVLEREHLNSTLAFIPHLALDYTAEEFSKMYDAMIASTSRVDLKFASDDLGAIRRFVDGGIKTNISTQDALCAYLISIIASVTGDPVNYIYNHIGVGPFFIRRSRSS